MKLINAYELKTMLLEERDKIPLTVPGATYEFGIPKPNKHGESMRGGIRIALRCLEQCQPVLLDEARPHGRWNIVEFDKDSRRITIECSECGMVEEMTVMAYGFGHNFCHVCGADVRGGGEDA